MQEVITISRSEIINVRNGYYSLAKHVAVAGTEGLHDRHRKSIVMDQ